MTHCCSLADVTREREREGMIALLLLLLLLLLLPLLELLQLRWLVRITKTKLVIHTMSMLTLYTHTHTPYDAVHNNSGQWRENSSDSCEWHTTRLQGWQMKRMHHDDDVFVWKNATKKIDYSWSAIDNKCFFFLRNKSRTFLNYLERFVLQRH